MTDDRHLLDQLQKDGILSFTPSRSYDDELSFNMRNNVMASLSIMTTSTTSKTKAPHSLKRQKGEDLVSFGPTARLSFPQIHWEEMVPVLTDSYDSSSFNNKSLWFELFAT